MCHPHPSHLHSYPCVIVIMHFTHTSYTLMYIPYIILKTEITSSIIPALSLSYPASMFLCLILDSSRHSLNYLTFSLQKQFETQKKCYEYYIRVTLLLALSDISYRSMSPSPVPVCISRQNYICTFCFI
jgi:hypothetical protein